MSSLEKLYDGVLKYVDGKGRDEAVKPDSLNSRLACAVKMRKSNIHCCDRQKCPKFDYVNLDVATFPSALLLFGSHYVKSLHLVEPVKNDPHGNVPDSRIYEQRDGP